MKHSFLQITALLLCSLLQAQPDPIAEIQGRLSIYLPDDTTSVHIGKNTGINQDLTSERYNTFVGTNAGFTNDIGDNNSFFGSAAGRANQSGKSNSYFGSLAGYNNSSGEENCFYGVGSGFLGNGGIRNCFFGTGTGAENEGDYNNFFGHFAGFRNDDGNQNVAIGAYAFHTNRTASWNVALGDSSMYHLEGDFDDYPHRNVAVGAGSLMGKNLVLSQNSIAIGFQAGYEGGLNSVFLGHQAGKGAASLINKLYISNKAGDNPLVYGDFDDQLIRINGRFETSDQIVLENASDIVFKMSDGMTEKAVLTLHSDDDTYLDGERHLRFRTGASTNQQMIITDNGSVGVGTTNPLYLFQVGENGDGSEARANVWSILSDRRWKTALKQLPSTLENVGAIGGYYYHWKEGADKSRQIGFMAQEIEAVYPEIVSKDSEGYLSVDYSKMTPILLQAIKEQQAIIEKQQNQIDQQAAEMSLIKSELAEIYQLINQPMESNANGSTEFDK
ncbi:MAG: tail fiber domain-containing protein [Saprospiraceae bacterium]|nr:tail fiber domain-containing protein [Saprospiraceae bacterium]